MKYVAVIILSALFFAILHYTSSRAYLDRQIRGKNLQMIRDQGLDFISYVNDNHLKTGGHYAHSCMMSNDVSLPPAIRELNPRSVAVDNENVLLIALRAPRRVLLLVFPANVQQNATEKLMDGLWFWSGNGDYGPHAAGKVTSP